MTFEEHQSWERDWHGNCVNEIGEKLKQFTYMVKMGILWRVDRGSSLWLNVKDISVVDIGGGCDSALLQTSGVKGTVIDPCDYPSWVVDRYKCAGIEYIKMKAEDIDITDPAMRFDECWMYNVLQHVENPEKVVKNAMAISKIVRYFDCIDYPASPGHPNVLTENSLNQWFNSSGTSQYIDENGFKGKVYYGIFKGNL
jgi:2-polyprenyl-3-methyl-5-hydroxy-6-metoxy-1,4-benzoquinol methylase